MTLARHVREAVAKLRDVPMTEHCGSCNGLGAGAVNRIADDLDRSQRHIETQLANIRKKETGRNLEELAAWLKAASDAAG